MGAGDGVFNLCDRGFAHSTFETLTDCALQGMTPIYWEYKKTIKTIKNCYSYQTGAIDTPKLVPVSSVGLDEGRMLARVYRPVGENVPDGCSSEPEDTIEVRLPTNAPSDPFNLLKMNTIGPTMV